MTISIKYGVNEYHIEHPDTTDIEVYLNGMFVHGFTNICSAIGHCLERKNFEEDLQYTIRNRQ